MINSIPPGLILLVGAGLLPLLGKSWRGPLLFGLPLLALWQIWTVPEAPFIPFLDYALYLVHPSSAGRLFATAFALITLVGGLFALQQARTIELVGAFLQAGSAIGVCFSGDWFSLFLFWEIMALASTMVIWSGDSQHAGMRYLLVHLLGGMLLLGGILMQLVNGGGLSVQALATDQPASLLILCGLLLNAGAPPLSAWIADAYPAASPIGTVFLSAYTTKTAVFTLLICFPGYSVLIAIGLYMIFYGIFYALLENDIRRILAYSIVNQVGFMITAIGIGTPMALNGAIAHAFAHIIYKALLLMTAGTVILMTGQRRCTDVGGLFRSMPFTTICGLIGALSISAFPLTSGFISKSMINQAATESQSPWLWGLLTAASAGVFLHAGIKFPWFVFFQKDSGLRPPDPPWNQRIAMALFACLCLGLGIFPSVLYAFLPYPVFYQPYTLSHIVSQFQLLLFSGLAFFLFLPWMKRTLTISLDFDWCYRYFGAKVLTILTTKVETFYQDIAHASHKWITLLIRTLFYYFRPDGHWQKTWSTGNMALLVAVFLAMYLLLNFSNHVYSQLAH